MYSSDGWTTQLTALWDCIQHTHMLHLYSTLTSKEGWYGRETEHEGEMGERNRERDRKRGKETERERDRD